MASWGVRCSWLGVVVLAIGGTGATAQPAPATPEPRSPAAPTGAAADLHDAGFAHAKAWRTSKDRRDLEQAERLFKQALALGDSALIECDLAISLLHLDAPARALALFARCVPRLAAIDPKIVNRYRDREGELLGKIGATHVAVDVTTSPPGAVVSISSFPADETVVTPSLVWLPVGEHTLVAHVDGQQLSGDPQDGARHRAAVGPGDQDVESLLGSPTSRAGLLGAHGRATSRAPLR